MLPPNICCTTADIQLGDKKISLSHAQKEVDLVCILMLSSKMASEFITHQYLVNQK
jgi:hypothetical protein